MFSYIFKEKNETSFEEDFENSSIRDTSLFDTDYQNIINAFLNIDEPFIVYQNIIKSKTLKDLPERYQNLFVLIRKKIMDFLKIGVK
jgi:hypothetical protein